MSKRDDAKIMIVDLLSGLWEIPEISWTSRQMYKDRARDFVDFLIDAAKEEMDTASSTVVVDTVESGASVVGMSIDKLG